MDYIDYDMNGFDLHVIKTDRFKTISYNINIRFDDEKDTERYMGLLSRLLIQTSKKYDSLRDINVACASIYDPSYNIRVLSSGSKDILTLTASFANEKYTEAGMNEANFKFLTSFIFEPKIIDNGFDREVFEIQSELFGMFVLKNGIYITSVMLLIQNWVFKVQFLYMFYRNRATFAAITSLSL